MDQKQIFKEFVTSRFLAYEQAQGRRVTVTEFAKALTPHAESGEEIGPAIFQGDVSHWLKGNRIPGIKLLKILSKSPWIGAGVWSAAGYEFEPDTELDPLEQRTINALRFLPRDLQEQYAGMIEQAAEENKTSQDAQEGGISQFPFQAAA